MVGCEKCNEVIEEESRFYVLYLACARENTKEMWDYDKEEVVAYYCVDCAPPEAAEPVER